MDLLDYLSKHCEQLYQQQGLLAQQKQQQLPPKITQNQKPSTSALHNKQQQHKLSVGGAGKNVKTAKVFYVFLN